MDMYDAFDAHMTWLEKVKERKAQTLKSRRQEIAKLLAWVEDRDVVDCTELNRKLVNDFVADMYSTVAQTTRNTYVSHLRGWFAWLRREQLLGSDEWPDHDLETISDPRPANTDLPRVAEEEVWMYADRAKERHISHWAYILCSFYMAKRMDEMRDMRIKDVDFAVRPYAEDGMFSFVQNKTKGTKETLPIFYKLRPILEEYFAAYEELLGRRLRGSDYLVPRLVAGGGYTLPGMPKPMKVALDDYGMTEQRSGRALMRMLTSIGMPPSHGIRRGAADFYTDEFDDMRVAKTMLGHDRESTTERYIGRRRDVMDVGRKFNKKKNGTDGPAPAVEPAAQEPESNVSDFLAARQRRTQRQIGFTG